MKILLYDEFFHIFIMADVNLCMVPFNILGSVFNIACDDRFVLKHLYVALSPSLFQFSTFMYNDLFVRKHLCIVPFAILSSIFNIHV